MSEPPDQWSLKQEIQKRKTQELIREVEAKRPSQLVAPTLPLTAPKAQRTTTSARITQSAPASKRTTQLAASVQTSPRWTKREIRIAAVASVLVMTVCLIMGLIASAVPPPQPAVTPLPKV